MYIKIIMDLFWGAVHVLISNFDPFWVCVFITSHFIGTFWSPKYLVRRSVAPLKGKFGDFPCSALHADEWRQCPEVCAYLPVKLR